MKLVDEAAGLAATRHARHTHTAYVTMVAVDDDGQPMPVPALQATTPDELRREGAAQLRRSNRLAEREQILTQRGPEG